MAINEKYLDNIQSVITRHNNNSFTIKGWTITISMAIFALSGTVNEPFFALMPIVPIIIFWRLDSFYLANERCFICLYNAAINEYSLKVKNSELQNVKKVRFDIDKEVDNDQNDQFIFRTKEYSMDINIFKKIRRNNWKNTFRSTTIYWFYLLLIFFSFIIFLGFNIFLEKPKYSFSVLSKKQQNENFVIEKIVTQSTVDYNFFNINQNNK